MQPDNSDFKRFMQEKLEKLLSTPSYLIERFLTLNLRPIKLIDYQKEIVDDTNSFYAVNKSRRLGFSTVIAALRGMINTHRFSNYTCYFVSYNLEEAKERIRIARMAYEDMPEFQYGKQIRKKLKTDSKTALEFYDFNNKSVSRLISVPCRILRGGEGDVVLDEIAFYREAHSVYLSSMPYLAVGGKEFGGYKMFIASTPLGKKGFFHELMTSKDKYKEFKKFNIPWWHSPLLCVNIEEAKKLAPYMATEDRVLVYGTQILNMIREQMYIEDFQQEFECDFIDEKVVFLSYDLIKSCMPDGSSKVIDNDDNVDDAPKDITLSMLKSNIAEVPYFKNLDEFLINYNRDIHGAIYAGFDVGRDHDASELFILGQVESDLFVNWGTFTWSRMPFPQQKDNLRKLLKAKIVTKLAIDKTGMGRDIGDTMHSEFPLQTLEVFFTSGNMEKMANDLYLGFEQKKFLLTNDRELFKQLHSVNRITTSVSRYSKFSVDNSETKAHADKFWAMALAYHGCIGGKIFATGYMDEELKNTEKVLSRKESMEVYNTDSPLTKTDFFYSIIDEHMK